MGWIRLTFTVIAILLVDFYFYQAIITLTGKTKPILKKIIRSGYWSLTFFSLCLAFAFTFIPQERLPKALVLYSFSLVVTMLFCKVIGIIPILLDDILRLIKWIVRYFRHPVIPGSNKGIDRLTFLNRIAVVSAGLPFSGFLYGMIKSAFDYRIHHLNLIIPGLPPSFNGLKIVHISDIHVGSFISEKPLANAVKLIGDQKPDIIFFTGDLINNITAETNGFFHVLKNIQAPLGVLSVLGNHDYGFYNVNYSEKERLKNFEMLKKFQKELGWKLLLNEHHRIRKGNDEIAVIGVENWSSFLHFPRFGNLERALEGTDNVPVKILLTHDPTHWSGEVIGKDHNINLTLSGHTHGMQMGIEVPGFRWSPVQYIYEHWAGLYSNRNRFLYVNRGLGFIGYMGRLGILPEITVFNIFAE